LGLLTGSVFVGRIGITKEKKMKCLEDRHVLEFSREEVYVLIDSLMYAQGMTQKYLREEDIGITVTQNVARVNNILDGLLDLNGIKVDDTE
jgi:hypothetical protein